MIDITEIEEYTKKDNIIEGIMKSKGLYCLVSNAKVGKSMFAIQLSNSLVNNKQFLGYNVFPTPVLYISTESDRRQIKELDLCQVFRHFFCHKPYLNLFQFLHQFRNPVIYLE